MGDGVGFVILAAGEASRMGAPKQLLPFRGKPMLLHVLDQVGRSPRSLVIGAHRDAVLSALPTDDPGIVENPNWKTGPGSSIKTGLRSLLQRHPELEAVIILLADQPLVDVELIRQLKQSANRHPGKAVAVKYKEGAGVPALFPRKFFDHLLELDDAQGAKFLLRKKIEEVCLIEAGGRKRDIDTPEEYRDLK